MSSESRDLKKIGVQRSPSLNSSVWIHCWHNIVVRPWNSYGFNGFSGPTDEKFSVGLLDLNLNQRVFTNFMSSRNIDGGGSAIWKTHEPRRWTFRGSGFVLFLHGWPFLGLTAMNGFPSARHANFKVSWNNQKKGKMRMAGSGYSGTDPDNIQTCTLKRRRRSYFLFENSNYKSFEISEEKIPLVFFSSKACCFFHWIFFVFPSDPHKHPQATPPNSRGSHRRWGWRGGLILWNGCFLGAFGIMKIM